MSGAYDIGITISSFFPFLLSPSRVKGKLVYITKKPKDVSFHDFLLLEFVMNAFCLPIKPCFDLICKN